MAFKMVALWLCVLQLSASGGGRPLRKRTVGEVQFLHNQGEHREVQRRREWLQMRLRHLHTAGGGDEAVGGRRRSRLEAGGLSDLRNFTPEEIQQALNLLDRLLESKLS